MKKILFSKYNSLRQPQFQTETRIIEEDGVRYVDKRPVRKAAQPHIEGICDKYEQAAALYGDGIKNAAAPGSGEGNDKAAALSGDHRVRVVPCRRTKDGVAFDYICGESLLSELDFERDPLPILAEKIKQKLAVITAVSPDKICDFVPSEEFAAMFPDCQPGACRAYAAANMDAVFSNFIYDGTDVWCIDYEWMFDFAIPADYISYRAVLYVYKEKEASLSARTCEREFLIACGILQAQLPLYEKMEYCFQQYVHGKDVRYIYTEKYKKPVETEAQLRQTICDKENHIQNLAVQIADMSAHMHEQEVYIAKVRRAMKNPLYAASLAGKKLARKLHKNS